MAGKGTKVEGDAISEILVADSDWELGAEGSNVEDYFEDEEERRGGGTTQAAAAGVSKSQTTGCN